MATEETKTDAWEVRCTLCGVTVAEGVGQAPTQIVISGEGGEVGAQIRRHAAESAGVHRYQLVMKRRVTE